MWDDLLFCPQCREWFPEEPRWLSAQWCEKCGTELQGEQPRTEVDFRELDTGYEEEQEEENEQAEDAAKSDNGEAD